jgi:IMP dehydrogenase
VQPIEEALTFDDVSLVPAYSSVLPGDVDLRCKLTREIDMPAPLVAAAMDTVTEARLAIAMAQEGGIGVIHKNMSIEKQAQQVRVVKKYEAGVIKDPITVTPDSTIREVQEITRQNNISGVPVVERGGVNDGELVGIVTSRDMRFETRLADPVRNIMTSKEKLITVQEDASQDEVLSLLHKHRIEKVLVVNDRFELRGLITVKDIQKSTDFPNAAKDSQERLIVAAAVGVGGQTNERVAELVAANVDVIVVDTAHGHTLGVIDQIGAVKQAFPDIQVIGGNVTTAEGALALVEAGADGVKVGQGPGSICTTRIVAGVGVPQITAVANVAAALKSSGVPAMADGGVRFSGDFAKAIAAGAWTVMIGSLFAGTEEAPGEVDHAERIQ